MRAGLLAVLLASLCSDLQAGCRSFGRRAWGHCAECSACDGQLYDYRASFNYPWDKRRGPAFGPTAILPYESEPALHELPPQVLRDLSEEVEADPDPRIIRLHSAAVPTVAPAALSRKTSRPAAGVQDPPASVVPAAHHQRAPEVCEPKFLVPPPASSEQSVLRFLLENSGE